MPIKKIREDLHKKQSKYARREHEKTAYHEWEFEENNKNNKTTWEKLRDRFFATKVKAIISGAIILLVITITLLSVTAFVYFQKSFFTQNNVTLNIIAPTTADSNDLVEITFEYENKNRAALKDSEIKVQFGKYFVPVKNQINFKVASLNSGVIEIGNINPFGKESVTIAGHFVGPENFVENVEGNLSYQPEKTSTIYSTQGKASTTITSSPIVISFESPKEIVSGSSLDLKITCRNTSRESIRDVKLIINYPNTFSFKDAEPNFAQDKVWFIDELSPQKEQEFTLQGILGGDIGISQKFEAQVETQASQGDIIYAVHEYAPTIINAPIILSQSTGNKIVYAGDVIDYTIKFTNDSDVPIRDAILNVVFEDRVLNFNKLDLNKKGFYDSKNKNIIWKASDVPALKLIEPHESGEVYFNIPLKENLPIQDTTDTNFIIETRASIDSEDVPSPIRANKTILTNSLIVKVGTQVPFIITGKYKEGELPPRVGKETIYTLTIEAGSYNNDLKDVEISAVLPTGVFWKENVEGDKKDSLSFNERANTMNWKIGGITHGEGLLTPTQKISFDISIIPSVDQIGKTPILMKDIILKANDIFTNIDISKRHDKKTTYLEDEQTHDNNTVVE
ncbi:MAG: hypothetical protein KAT32_02650 [Candidatus Moranbacteria bacterium]|nr:hypothetical protein [Candidatus Moranbacteria bacterium]